MKKLKTYESFHRGSDPVTMYSPDKLTKFFDLNNKDFVKNFLGIEFDGDDEFEITMYAIGKPMDLSKIQTHKFTTDFEIDEVKRGKLKLAVITFKNKKFQKELQ